VNAKLQVVVKLGYDTLLEVSDNELAAQVLLMAKAAPKDPQLQLLEEQHRVEVRAKDIEWSQQYAARQKAEKELKELRDELTGLHASVAAAQAAKEPT
jgi:hypothetical protein